MNLIKTLLGLIGGSTNEQAQYNEPQGARFKDLRNPEAAVRKPAAFDVEPEAKPAPAPLRKPKAHTVEREPVKAAEPPRKPQAYDANRDDFLVVNPAANIALWPAVLGSNTAAAEDKAPLTSHHTSSDFSKAVEDTPAPAPTSHDIGSSHSTYDSGNSSSTTAVDTTPTYSPPADTGGFSGGGFDGGSSVAFAPAWR